MVPMVLAEAERWCSSYKLVFFFVRVEHFLLSIMSLRCGDELNEIHFYSPISRRGGKAPQAGKSSDGSSSSEASEQEEELAFPMDDDPKFEKREKSRTDKRTSSSKMLCFCSFSFNVIFFF